MRVGAMEQLERWGKHMESRVFKAERTDDLKITHEQFKNMEVSQTLKGRLLDLSGISDDNIVDAVKKNVGAHNGDIITILNKNEDN